MINQRGLRRLYLLAALLLPFTMCVHVVLSGRAPDAQGFQLYQYLYLMLVAVWLMKDPALPAVHRPSFDHALLLCMTFPFLALYHQFITRRWKGIATVSGLLLLLYAPYAVMIVLLLPGGRF